MSTRLRVLLGAFACNPFEGSESGVGWGWAVAIAQEHDAHVLVPEYQQEAIERGLAELPGELRRPTFHFVPSRPWHFRPTPLWKWLEAHEAKPLVNVAYRVWQLDAYRLAKELHRARVFNLAHQITYVGFRFPGHLWKLGIPFVWGPLGGLENTPWRLLGVMGLRGALYFAGRNLLNSLNRSFRPAPRRALKLAGPGVIAATSSIQRELQRIYGVESSVVCEVGLPSPAVSSVPQRATSEPLAISWSGNHEPAKALPLLLKAVSLLPARVSWRLDILGSGRLTGRWKALALSLGIAPHCRWLGHLARHQALGVVGSSHLFVITSLKDLTSNVLVEALSQGVPVICPDHCGFSDVVDHTCGIKLPITSPSHFVENLAESITQLADDEERRTALALGATERCSKYSWAAKTSAVSAIYRKVFNLRTRLDVR